MLGRQINFDFKVGELYITRNGNTIKILKTYDNSDNTGNHVALGQCIDVKNPFEFYYDKNGRGFKYRESINDIMYKKQPVWVDK